MQKIVPHLWFNTQAKEAAAFYTSLFPNSRIITVRTITGTPSGDCDIVSFSLAGQDFMAISAGPLFRFNPSISFHVKCQTKAEVDTLWAALSAGGEVLMELGSYPFSERYGWCNDKYGLSWQIIYTGDQPITQKITPVLMFVGAVCGQAETAVNFYNSVFPDSKINVLMRREQAEGPDQAGTVRYAGFNLLGTEFGAMDSAGDHKFAFNEAISFIVNCGDQAEIDYYWKKLSAVPAAEQCGWLKDQYGVSWQIVPTAMNEMMASGDKNAIERVTQAFLQMKKFDIAALQKAFNSPLQ